MATLSREATDLNAVRDPSHSPRCVPPKVDANRKKSLPIKNFMGNGGLNHPLVMDFLDSMTNPSTQRHYSSHLKFFMEWLDLDGLDPIRAKRPDLYRYGRHVDKKEWAESTKANVFTAIRSFYQHLTNLEKVPVNPALVLSEIGVKYPPLNPKPLADMDIQKLLKSLTYGHIKSCKTSAAILLGLYQGMRVSEVANLEWESVDFGRDLLTWKAKGGKKRTAPMCPAVKTALYRLQGVSDNYYGGLFPWRYVFHGYRDIPMTAQAFQYSFKRQAEKCKIDGNVTFHQLRHTLGTSMYKSGASVYEIRDTMGHSSIKTSEHYVKVDEERTRVAHFKAISRMAPGS